MPRIDRRHIHRRLITREIRVEQADGALRILRRFEHLAPLLHIRPGIANVACFVLETATHRQRGIGLLVLEQHKLSLKQVCTELEQTGRVDALLEHSRRPAARGDGRIQRLFHRLLIRSEMPR